MFMFVISKQLKLLKELILDMVSKPRASMEQPKQSPAFASTISPSNGLASFNPKTFTNLVSFKLNEESLLPWRHQSHSHNQGSQAIESSEGGQSPCNVQH